MTGESRVMEGVAHSWFWQLLMDHDDGGQLHGCWGVSFCPMSAQACASVVLEQEQNEYGYEIKATLMTWNNEGDHFVGELFCTGGK